MDPQKHPRPILAAVNRNAPILPPPIAERKGYQHEHIQPMMPAYNHPPSRFQNHFPSPSFTYTPPHNYVPLNFQHGPHPPLQATQYPPTYHHGHSGDPRHGLSPASHPLRAPAHQAVNIQQAGGPTSGRCSPTLQPLTNIDSNPFPYPQVPRARAISTSRSFPPPVSERPQPNQAARVLPNPIPSLSTQYRPILPPKRPTFRKASDFSETASAGSQTALINQTSFENPNTSSNLQLSPEQINAWQSPAKKPEKPVAKLGPAITFKKSILPYPAPSPVNQKRKASDVLREDIDIDDDRCQAVDISCDRVRTKIQNFLNSGAMKVSEFQKAIGTTSKSYGSFMGQQGPYKGMNSMVYQNAFAFFKHRELAGIATPKKKKVDKAEEDSLHDVSMVRLSGEESTSVEVYDTCDDVRRRIRAHLALPNVTQAGFLCEIAKTYPAEQGKKIQSKVLNDFLRKSGPTAGNTSSVYYAGYVFFEKVRIRDEKAKSKQRLELESIYNGKHGSSKGMDIRHRGGDMVLCLDSERPVINHLGRLEIVKERPRR